MSWDQYHLLRPLHVSPRGIHYEATDDGGAIVDLFALDRAASGWPALTRRLRLASLLQHPGALRICELALDAEPPYAVVDRPTTRPLVESLAGALPLPVRQIVVLAQRLADVFAAAHQLGLVHGAFCPTSILETPSGTPLIDFTGLSPVAEVGANWRPPEPTLPDQPDPAADLFALGTLLTWLLTGKTARDSASLPAATLGPVDFAVHRELQALVRELSSDEPADRPSASSVAARLGGLLKSGAAVADLQATMASMVAPPAHETTIARQAPDRLGRFRLLEKLGEGGMGVVYRAADATDGAVVAVKILKADFARHPTALKRFQKEARMLAAVRNPYVANLLEVNEQDGIHFLAMEFVAGRSLRALLDAKGRLPEPEALAVIADVCRALAAAHANGVVHRDVKPENILIANDGESAESATHRVKLTDFGLARQVEQSASLNLTQENMIGTPLYMAPEQGQGGKAIDARTDVYSLGATLFHLLAGRPPFTGETPMAVLLQHAHEPLPSLTALNPTLSDGAVRIVERAMAKRPGERFADGAEMLREIERLQRGEPSSLAIHPLLPQSKTGQVRELVFRWELDASPEQLWPHVSNTERLNRAIGLPAVKFTNRRVDGRARRFAEARKIGLRAHWEEHPFEWVEGRRFGVLREMSSGPFEWIVSVVELEPRTGGGTALTHTIRLLPRGWLGRVVAAVELGVKTRRALDRVYRRIDRVATGANSPLADHFEDAPRLSGGRLRRLEQGLARLVQRGVLPAVAETLGDYLTQSPDQAVARIRPLSVASRLGLDPELFVNACLLAANEGLLLLMWDILCPVCRIPSQFHDSLKTIREHGSCEVCNLDFDLDFANSVEMIFRVHPEIRAGELGTYCIGGPAHSPHVAAQVRVAGGERLDLALALPEGAYRLRGPQLPYAIDFRVAPGGRVHRWDLPLSRRPGSDLASTLGDGGQTFVVTNDTDQELVVRVERTAPRTDALTAARAAAMPLFRELFPHERLAPGMLVSVSQVTLLVTDVEGVGRLYREQGDAKAFAGIHEHLVVLGQVVKREGGAVVKAIGAGLMAAFHEPAAAVRAALDMSAALAASDLTRYLPVRYAVHRGPALTATINDRLDYFGATVNFAAELPGAARPGEVVLSRAVASDGQVAEMQTARGVTSEVIEIAFPDSGERFAHRLTLGAPNP